MRCRKQIALILLLFTLPGFAAEVGTSGPDSSRLPTQAQRAGDDEVVCRRQRVVGSNIPQQVCRTRGQLRREQEDSERLIQQIQTAPMLKRPRTS